MEQLLIPNVDRKVSQSEVGPDLLHPSAKSNSILGPGGKSAVIFTKHSHMLGQSDRQRPASVRFANLLMDEDFEEIGRQLAAQDEDEESQSNDQEDEP